MAVRSELAVFREHLERLSLELSVIAVDVVEDSRLTREESPVDPAFLELRFFGEPHDLVAFDVELSEPRGGTDGGYRDESSVETMEVEERVEVEVGDAVPPREEEGPVRAQ